MGSTYRETKKEFINQFETVAQSGVGEYQFSPDDFSYTDKSGARVSYDFDNEQGVVKTVAKSGGQFEKVTLSSFDDLASELKQFEEKFGASKPEPEVTKLSPENQAEINKSLFAEVAKKDANLDKIKELIKSGADLTAPSNPVGETALHLATFSGNQEVIKFLIEAGSNPNQPNKFGQTPLHTACFFGLEESAQTLLDQGADPNAKNNLGEQPLHLAALQGNKKMMEALLLQGADINARDKEGDTPINIAAISCDKETLQFLQDHGADMSSVNNFGEHSIHHAAAFDNVAAQEFFLEKDPTLIDVCDKNGAKPIHHAAQGGHEQSLEFLQGKGADVKDVDNDGKTTLDYAKSGRDSSKDKSLFGKVIALLENLLGIETPEVANVQENSTQSQTLFGKTMSFLKDLCGIDDSKKSNDNKVPTLMEKLGEQMEAASNDARDFLLGSKDPVTKDNEFSAARFKEMASQLAVPKGEIKSEAMELIKHLEELKGIKTILDNHKNEAVQNNGSEEDKSSSPKKSLKNSNLNSR